MELIAEYRRLTRDIAVINSKIRSKERDLSKLTMVYAPGDVKGIDYAKPSVQTSHHQPSIAQIAGEILNLNTEIMGLKAELNEVMDQRAALDRCIDNLRDVEAKVAMLRIQGWTNRQIAHEVGYSKRHVERIVCLINRLHCT